MRRLARWVLSPTGLVSSISAALVGVAIVDQDVRYVGLVGVAGFVVVLAQVATHSSRRTAIALAEAGRLQQLSERTRAELDDLSDQVDRLGRLATRTLDRVRDTETRANNLSKKTDTMLERIQNTERGVNSLTKKTDTMLERIQNTERGVNSLTKKTDTMLERIRNTERGVNSIDAQLGKLARALERLESSHERTRREDASLRSLAIAHNRAEPPLERVALLLTIHRSGSTRLFDMLRIHPAVRVAATMEIWHRLGLEGRRYPVAFSDTAEGRVAIEVEAGRGALIPALGPPAAGQWSGPQWAVEKAHPQFFDFDVDSFVDRVQGIRAAGIEMLVTYQVRRPLDAMWSMIEFKQRQPTWYAHLDPREVPDWILRSLRAIAESQQFLPGHVVDFDDIPFGDALAHLGIALAPDWTPEETAEWLTDAAARTDRSKRMQSAGAGFIGTPDPLRGAEGPDDCWIGLDGVIQEAVELYELIKSRRWPAV